MCLANRGSDPNFPSDFPILMHFSQKYGMLIIATKYGFLYLIELTTGSVVYSKRMTESPIFVGCKDTKFDGIYTINKNGQVLLSRIDENQMIPYLVSNCQFIPEIMQLAFKLAARYRWRSAFRVRLAASICHQTRLVDLRAHPAQHSLPSFFCQ